MPRMQGYFEIRKPKCYLPHQEIKRGKISDHLRNIEKAFDKIQYQFMIF